MSILIENKLFEYNPINLIKHSQGFYADNFFKYPEKIKHICLNAPFLRMWGVYDNVDATFYDDRRGYITIHRHPEYIETLKNISSLMFNISPERFFSWKGSVYNIAYNLFSCKNDMWKTHYYHPHSDGKNIIAGIVYLNDYYDQNDGTNFYDCKDDINQLWVEKNKINFTGHLQAVKNRLYLYDGSKYHGQAIISNRWINDFRITLVVFLYYK